MNNIDDALQFAVLAAIISVLRSAAVLAFLLDMVPQVSVLHKVLEVGLEGLAILSSVPVLLVVSTELALVLGG